jgi:uncharacterized protein (DUF2249 family)
VLIATAPQFKKLKNQRLRKTIARVTTLRQASMIAGLKAGDLVNKLRKEVGQQDAEGLTDEKNKYHTVRPKWFNEKAITATIDAGAMLNEGEHPVHEVLSQIKKLGKGEILKVMAPFLPAPLIDKAISLNYRHWVDQRSENEVYLYFTR